VDLTERRFAEEKFQCVVWNMSYTTNGKGGRLAAGSPIITGKLTRPCGSVGGSNASNVL
jgi:hypothetical protein